MDNTITMRRGKNIRGVSKNKKVKEIYTVPRATSCKIVTDYIFFGSVPKNWKRIL